MRVLGRTLIARAPTARTSASIAGWHSDPLPIGQAVLLGLVHGPAELMPISSSAHTVLIPWLAGWEYERLAPEARKSFEVALHAGATAALMISSRSRLELMLRGMGLKRSVMLASASAPAAFVGYFYERPIERRLSSPCPISIALAIGAVCMAIADARSSRGRESESAGVLDGALLGLAQAAALVPGVSRAGATLTVARARGFSRQAAEQLSWEVGLPVILGAGVLKAKRIASARAAVRIDSQLTAAAAAAFLATALSTRLIGRGAPRPLAPFALYRAGLSSLVILTSRRRRRARGVLAGERAA